MSLGILMDHETAQHVDRLRFSCWRLGEGPSLQEPLDAHRRASGPVPVAVVGAAAQSRFPRRWPVILTSFLVPESRAIW